MSETIEYDTPDGVTIRGTWEEEADASPEAIVLFLHGLAETRDEDRESQAGVPPFVQVSDALQGSGLARLRIDFRGHGESDGSLRGMTLAGETVDARAGLAFIRERHPGLPVHLVAASFGAIAALRLLGEPALGLTESRVVLWNPMLDPGPTFLRPVLPWGISTFGSGIDGKDEVDLGGGAVLGPLLLAELRDFRQAEARAFQQRILVIHGSRDSYVSVDAARRFGQALPEGRFIEVAGSEHGFGTSADREVLVPATLDWLRG